MKRWLFSLAVLVGALVLAGCAAKEAAPAAPAPAPPAAKPAWEEEWERVLAAARQEGKVVVAGQAGAEPRRALTEPFERKYGITVEYLGDGRTLAQRIRTERDAGHHLWDIFIGGGNTPDQILKPVGALEPIEPALILPEVKDPKNWFGGGIRFFDREGRFVVNIFAQVGPPIMFNPNVVRGEEMTGFKDLLNPKWKGKIVGDDPTRPGPGQSKWRLMAVNKELGPDFIRALLKQEITFTREDETALRWLAAGQYPVCVGCSDTTGKRLVKEGLPIRFLIPKEGVDITTSWGGVTLLNRAPHPNAARLYLNWLLSKEGQTEVAKLGVSASRRLDVTREHLEAWQIPKETYILMDSEETQAKGQAIISDIFKEHFGR